MVKQKKQKKQKKEKKAETLGVPVRSVNLGKGKRSGGLPAEKIRNKSNVRPEKSGKDKVCERTVIE